MMDEMTDKNAEHEANIFTYWSSVFEGPGPYWGLVGQECVGAHESVCVSGCCRMDWRNLRSPARGSSRSRWPRNHCGSDSEAYPPPHLLILNGEKYKKESVSSL